MSGLSVGIETLTLGSAHVPRRVSDCIVVFVRRAPAIALAPSLPILSAAVENADIYVAPMKKKKHAN